MWWFRGRGRKIRAFKIHQLNEKRRHMPITGIPQGSTKHFGLTDVPPGSALPAGVVPKWTSSDVTVATVVDPNPDATGLTAAVTGVAASGSFTLTATATLADGTVIQGSAIVPALPAPPPPVPTSFTINQLD
jgi:hypothetical protein